MKEGNTLLQLGILFAVIIVVMGPVTAFLYQQGFGAVERFVVVFVIALAVNYALRRFRQSQEKSE